MVLIISAVAVWLDCVFWPGAYASGSVCWPAIFRIKCEEQAKAERKKSVKI
jgi:hypothetical protein